MQVIFFTKSSISALSQVDLFNFSSNTCEAALNKPSLSTFSGSYLCASNITPTAVRFLVLFFSVFVVLVLTVFHTNHMFANDYNVVCTRAMSKYLNRLKKRQKTSGSDLWRVNRCIPNKSVLHLSPEFPVILDSG